MTRPTRGDHGDEGSADHHPERVGTDYMSRRGYRNAEVSGNVRQQSHHREFARTDAEAADG
jgi:hypothetical protein